MAAWPVLTVSRLAAQRSYDPESPTPNYFRLKFQNFGALALSTLSAGSGGAGGGGRPAPGGASSAEVRQGVRGGLLQLQDYSTLVSEGVRGAVHSP